MSNPSQVAEFEDFTEPDDGVTERCRLCKRGYMLWNAPQPLWNEVNGRYGGTLCPRCFDQFAREKGYRLTWVPMIHSRDGVPTTNWWGDPTRDRLLMGEPDPHYFDGEEPNVPQGHWGRIAEALGWPLETPYPTAVPTMPGVEFVDSGVNAEAQAYKDAHPELVGDNDA